MVTALPPDTDPEVGLTEVRPKWPCGALGEVPDGPPGVVGVGMVVAVWGAVVEVGVGDGVAGGGVGATVEGGGGCVDGSVGEVGVVGAEGGGVVEVGPGVGTADVGGGVVPLGGVVVEGEVPLVPLVPLGGWIVTPEPPAEKKTAWVVYAVPFGSDAGTSDATSA